ncbi:small acidic protein [Plakobranchus ocellatus]|uniref:Small acidic protein n=1 Tax=Plakobranchus ocellatus TaxID=259542 RepID=A0AAV3XZL1_9GAST|nr:small acidic protein [Plakobranchus ocellatus]
MDDTTTVKQKASEEKTIEVHSANSWETADLGDKQRNEKFLRLMGASKKEHHGKIVIGEKTPTHARDRAAEAQRQEELEEQFSQGMEHRLAGGKKGHLGLGFHPDEKGESEGGAAEKEADDDDKTEKEADDDKTEKEASPSEKTSNSGSQSKDEQALSEQEPDSCKKEEKKRESLDKDGEHERKKMKFIKSSS